MLWKILNILLSFYSVCQGPFPVADGAADLSLFLGVLVKYCFWRSLEESLGAAD